jgi:alkylation response protein AidB-like acyl-CoA dehydrogenase
MDFGFTAEQEMLRAEARRFLEAKCPSALVRAMLASATAHSPELWHQVAELGWLGILVPEELGGMGGNFLDMTVVLEEAGRALLPGPFLAGAVVGTVAIREAGAPELRERLLPEVARGDRVVTLALSASSAPGDAPPAATLRSNGGTHVISGTIPFVMDAHVADTLIVPAIASSDRAGDASRHDPPEITLLAVDRRAPGVEVTPLATVDMTRRLCTIVLRDVVVPAEDVLAAPDAAAHALRRVVDSAVAALAVEAVGTAQRALDMSVGYANERTQFGRPIGSFQAVKHKCVDMMVAVETARSLAYYAAWAVSESTSDAGQASAMAKAYCGEMARTVASEAIQVHGGIGFTWEHDLHLYYRRALASEAAFGAAPAHRERILAPIAP